MHNLISGINPILIPDRRLIAPGQALVPSGLPLLFAADWAGATGSGSGALRNTLFPGGGVNPKPLTDTAGNGTSNVVVPRGSAVAVGFPANMINVYRTVAGLLGAGPGAGAQRGRILIASNIIPEIAIGVTRYWRLWHAFLWPNSWAAPPTFLHTPQDGEAGGSVTTHQLAATWQGNSFYMPEFDLGNNGANVFPNNRWRPLLLNGGLGLPINEAFMFEFAQRRTGAMTFQYHGRITNSASVVIANDADWINTNSSATLASVPTFNYNAVAFTNNLTRAYQWPGFNGFTQGGAGDFPINIYEDGGVAIQDVVEPSFQGNWIGAYDPSERTRVIP